ncbi:LOW QUALITY PROTEIN: hypothetical protein Nmel_000789, partial [Mimus melanotis]
SGSFLYNLKLVNKSQALARRQQVTVCHKCSPHILRDARRGQCAPDELHLYSTGKQFYSPPEGRIIFHYNGHPEDSSWCLDCSRKCCDHLQSGFTASALADGSAEGTECPCCGTRCSLSAMGMWNGTRIPCQLWQSIMARGIKNVKAQLKPKLAKADKDKEKGYPKDIGNTGKTESVGPLFSDTEKKSLICLREKKATLQVQGPSLTTFNGTTCSKRLGFRLSRSYKPEEPGSRPASSPEFCVYDTPSSSRPSPSPCLGPREPYLRASLPQHRDASGGRGELFHSSLHRFQGCEGFVDPGITSGTFLPLLPTPRGRGTVAKAAPGQPQCPPDTDRPRAAARELLPHLTLSTVPSHPFPGLGEPELQADKPPRSRPPSFSPPRALASSPSAPGAYGHIENSSERLR